MRVADISPAAVADANTKVLRIYPLEQADGEPDPTRCVVHMPIGSKPLGIVPQGGGQIGLAVIAEVVAARVPHPYLVMVLDQPYSQLIGHRFGEDGIFIFPISGTPAALVPDLPWPQPKMQG